MTATPGPSDSTYDGDLVFRRRVDRANLLIRLKRARESRGLTQGAVADAIGTTQSAISDLENARVDPRLDTLIRFASAVDLKLTLDSRVPTPLIGDLLSILYSGEPQSHSLEDLASRVSAPPADLRRLLERLQSVGWAQASDESFDTYMPVQDAADVMGISVSDDSVVGVLLGADRQLQDHETVRVQLERANPSRVESAVQDVAQRLQAKSERQVIGLGVSIAGIVDTPKGRVQLAPSLRHRKSQPLQPMQWDLGPRLRERLQHAYPVVVTNDANALAVAEFLAGETPNVAVLLLSGVGVGSGYVIDGRCPAGANAAAGEIGHVMMSEEGPACPSGLPHSGCIESFTSTKSLLSRLELPSSNSEERSRSLAKLDRMLATDDVRARSVVSEAAEALARAAGSTVHALDPDVLVVCGEPKLVGEAGLAATWFRQSFGAAFERQLSTRAPFLAAPELLWRPLHREDLAVAAGATALRHYLRYPEVLLKDMGLSGVTE